MKKHKRSKAVHYILAKRAFWKQTKALEQYLISAWNSSANAPLLCLPSWLLFIN